MKASYLDALRPNQYKLGIEGVLISRMSPIEVFERLLRQTDTASGGATESGRTGYVRNPILPDSSDNGNIETKNNPQNPFGLDGAQWKQDYGKYRQLYAKYGKIVKELLYRAKSKASKVYRDLTGQPEATKKIYEASVSALRRIYNPLRTAKLAERVLRLLPEYLRSSPSVYAIVKQPVYRIKAIPGGLEELLAAA